MNFPKLSKVAQNRIELANSRAKEIEIEANINFRKEDITADYIGESWASFAGFLNLKQTLRNQFPKAFIKVVDEVLGKAYIQAATWRFDALAQEYFAILDNHGEFEAVLDQIDRGKRNYPVVEDALTLRRAHWITRSKERQAALSVSDTNTSSAIPANASKAKGTSQTNLKAERKQLIQAYKSECAKEGIKVTDKMIAKAANSRWQERTPVQRWQRNYRSSPGDDVAIRRVLQQKPHLKK